MHKICQRQKHLDKMQSVTFWERSGNVCFHIMKALTVMGKSTIMGHVLHWERLLADILTCDSSTHGKCSLSKWMLLSDELPDSDWSLHHWEAAVSHQPALALCHGERSLSKWMLLSDELPDSHWSRHHWEAAASHQPAPALCHCLQAATSSLPRHRMVFQPQTTPSSHAWASLAPACSTLTNHWVPAYTTTHWGTSLYHVRDCPSSLTCHRVQPTQQFTRVPAYTMSDQRLPSLTCHRVPAYTTTY